MNFISLISSLEMENNGFYYIFFFSLIYFCISYFLLTKFQNEIYCIIAVILLNALSLSSIVIYCRHLKNEKEANIRGGHLIVAPLYLALFYLGYLILTTFRF